MKAVRLVQVQHPLEMQEIPVPTIGSRDVLVRVRATGLCHSDVHYRAGTSPVYPLPMTLGHEVAGVVEAVGAEVSLVKPGDRVCLHYMVTCGNCYYCSTGNEQFCVKGKMIGHYTDGGYAEYIAVPERNAVKLPDEISFEQGATLMCASATSFHALRKSRLVAGESVAIFGVGGLGMSAVQLARAFGALDVYAVDINPARLKLAEKYGAIGINAAEKDAVKEIKSLTGGKGVNVAMEVIGLPATMRQALQSLTIFGRAVIVGITRRPLEVDTYNELVGPETEIIGSDDHLLQELPLLLEYARRGALDLTDIVSRTIPLDAAVINQALDHLEQFGEGVRTVIVQD
ncbi:MAG: zinc-binding dehydrogenase [Anaerolineae bacterium]|nr:zinc-binding dehydrogenase [Anaerolineae bacterium]